MVFYSPLPVELWFIIYKMEHSMHLSPVNAEIKNLEKELGHVNARMFINIPLNEWGDIPSNIAWNLNEWLAFKNKTGASLDTEGSIIDGWNRHCQQPFRAVSATLHKRKRWQKYHRSLLLSRNFT